MGYHNRMISSKVRAILLDWYLFLICGFALGRVFDQQGYPVYFEINNISSTKFFSVFIEINIYIYVGEDVTLNTDKMCALLYCRPVHE